MILHLLMQMCYDHDICYGPKFFRTRQFVGCSQYGIWGRYQEWNHKLLVLLGRGPRTLEYTSRPGPALIRWSQRTWRDMKSLLCL